MASNNSKSLALVVLSIVLVGIIISGVFLIINSNDDVNGLETKTYSLESEINNLETENSALQSYIDSLEEEVDTLAMEKDTLETEKDTLKTEKDTLETENSDLETELENTQVDIEYWESEAEYWENVAIPSHFDSLKELKNWLAEDDTDSNDYIEDVFDCDDFALTLQQNAKEDGYIIDLQIIYADDCYYDHKGDLRLKFNYDYYYPAFSLHDFSSYHAVNTTIIGNSIYLIEPQNDEVLLLCSID